MKKEHFILLVFIASAALVSGYTLAFTSCYKVIMNQNLHPVAVIAEQQAGSKNIGPDISDTSLAAEDCTIACLTDVQKTEGTQRSTEVMVVDSLEKAEIEAMLTSLGLQEGQEYSQFIREFQQQQSLDPTGTLDSATLNLIMQQAKLEKVSKRLRS
ncbi:hypothetical protein ASZ90_018659 [hydrocarbon metagenome]|uniref:Uncharacterized protein n=1 Tax=hydrocarbon metagenome TaxID=938273 RepID=A0A0W8E5F8_9ZZZZ